MGHVVMENRNGLAVVGMVTQANGTAERRASEAMLKRKARPGGRRITVGEDKAYDSRDHVSARPRPAGAGPAPSTRVSGTLCRSQFVVISLL